ncbi:hypothetical protein D6T65_11830 [Arthrobacter frigidicola]|nr:hypothetical protein D6T65_11830 [Arthrobacter frigidicola]
MDLQMDSVLFVGGSGVVGRTAVRWFRTYHPDIPVFIGGRNVDAAREVAQDVGGAEAIKIDVMTPGLGIEDLDPKAVVMLAPDPVLYGLRYAQDRQIPYVSIGTGLLEAGFEAAHFARRPDAAPVVLASQWSAGAATFLALRAASFLDEVRSIRVGVVLDPDDPAGPAALEDMKRQQESGAAALVVRDGHRELLSGAAGEASVTSVDGRGLDAVAFSPLDITSLHAATGASDIQVNIATEVSSSHRRGEAISAEIVVDVTGVQQGQPKNVRASLEFAEGQASLTGLLAVLSVSAVLGLGGNPPRAAGLYMPELLMTPDEALTKIRDAGGVIKTGEPTPVQGDRQPNDDDAIKQPRAASSHR